MTLDIPRGRRRIDREHFPVVDRLALLEDDMDASERDRNAIRRQLQESIDNTNRILIGLLVAIAAASVIGALNLLIAK